jgi:uncharacterized protein YoxC
MTGTEMGVMIAAIASVAGVVLLGVALLAMHRTLREMRRTVELLQVETKSVIDELSDTVAAANYELHRIDRMVGTAETISGTVDAASRLAYTAVSNPMIKGLAVASGTGRAARSFRRRRGT